MTALGRNAGPPPAPPDGEIAVAAPPSVTLPDSGVPLARLLPAVMAVGMLAMTAVVYRSGSSAARSPVFAMLPLMMLASAVAATVAGRNRGPKNIDDAREGYLDYLAALRESVTDTAARQRSFLWWAHPEPDALWLLAGSARMWERRPGDADFGCVRVGIGPTGLATRLVPPPQDPARRIDPVTDTALRRFLETHATVPEVPITVPLLGAGPLLLDGDADAARGLLRAMICQLAMLHGPDGLRIAAVTDAPDHWDWLKWLPHHQNPSDTDATGPLRLTCPSLAAAEAALAGRRAVVISDSTGAGLSVAEAGTAGTARRLTVTATALSDPEGARPDFLGIADAVVCAQRLAGQRANAAGGGRPADWAQLLRIGDIDRYEPAGGWAGAPSQRLCVPIGTDPNGNVVRLDIKEAAERGSGPHGLCIGATGSGKSEFLRTLVLGMTVRHSPEDLNLVLVDFKGGATFLGFEQTRHVSAVITNLANEAPLVERMRDALASEMRRRQELLRATGVAGISSYGQARQASGMALPALPALLVIVDEFSELLDQHPDFIDTFLAIGRLGRSLGIHLLLASQRLEEGRLRGLESHLSYRVCLKTVSAAESRLVLGVADARELPNIPGAGVLRTADGELTRFQAAYVSGGCPAARPAPREALWFTAVPSGPIGVVPAAAGRTVLEAILQRISGHGPAARQVWLPPLGASPALGALLEGEYPALSVPIGIVDRPFEQRRTPLSVHLEGAGGHVAVVGAPRSGKSTTLATLIAALSATHDASRVGFYCLDFGGGTLSELGWLPQVGSVAGRGQPDLVRRTIAEMEAIVQRREAAGGACDGGPARDVFLVIDGWAGLCQEFDVESAITALAGRGLSFRVHVVLSASRWAEVRPALRDLIGTRIELRLGDPAESELDRRQAHRVPRDRPGRGLTPEGLHMLVALPHEWEPLQHNGYAVPPIPLLPERVERAELVVSAGDQPVLGADERGPVTVDFARQPHLLILGDNECGKSTVLRTLCRELVRTHTPEQAQLLVVDYRRSLLGVVDVGHLAGYAMSATACSALLPAVIERVAGRMPGPDVSPQQLRDRSWWRGPQIYILVDDYDLVATAAGNPLTPLLEYLPQAGDLGLHLVVARRSGGAARSMYEPVLAALHDLGAMGLVMSGDPADTPLIGSVRPRPLPPGRATLVTRSGGERPIQVAWEP
ncbi:type VII secretion protein EccCb [Mycolicibacter sinensis]|uniref:Type VII secretion protein EccCb n=1 Tax=Mycolicibacter sinensis (strain JDM601) TaxID=875328 RepID=A0A1A3U3Q9_MYCSD|nr:type VII secretion protein EccCb [Mycolicibacter sinensis]OBK89327.1 type VII secretion protein EccCb [Mycolicibacter sinensis]